MKVKSGLFLMVVLAVVFPVLGNAAEKLDVRSSAFGEGASIPSNYTCDDADQSIPLAWSSVPQATQSLAIVANDPDAPTGDWIHWSIYNLAPTLMQLPAGIPAEAILADGGFQGRNDFGKIGYGGPCPPEGTHRYIFTVYALDKILHLEPGATPEQLEQAMAGHILAEGVLTGTYERV